jgi:hypothetical protein
MLMVPAKAFFDDAGQKGFQPRRLPNRAAGLLWVLAVRSCALRSLARADLQYPREAICDLADKLSLAIVDFSQQRVAAFRWGLHRSVVGTGPDFDLRKKHLGYSTINL